MSSAQFTLLGFNFRSNPTEREVTIAYRKLSLRWHPDKAPDDPNASRKFCALNDAYEAVKKKLTPSNVYIQLPSTSPAQAGPQAGRPQAPSPSTRSHFERPKPAHRASTEYEEMIARDESRRQKINSDRLRAERQERAERQAERDAIRAEEMARENARQAEIKAKQAEQTKQAKHQAKQLEKQRRRQEEANLLRENLERINREEFARLHLQHEQKRRFEQQARENEIRMSALQTESQKIESNPHAAYPWIPDSAEFGDAFSATHSTNISPVRETSNLAGNHANGNKNPSATAERYLNAFLADVASMSGNRSSSYASQATKIFATTGRGPNLANMSSLGNDNVPNSVKEQHTRKGLSQPASYDDTKTAFEWDNQFLSGNQPSPRSYSDISKKVPGQQPSAPLSSAHQQHIGAIQKESKYYPQAYSSRKTENFYQASGKNPQPTSFSHPIINPPYTSQSQTKGFGFNIQKPLDSIDQPHYPFKPPPGPAIDPHYGFQTKSNSTFEVPLVEKPSSARTILQPKPKRRKNIPANFSGFGQDFQNVSWSEPLTPKSPSFSNNKATKSSRDTVSGKTAASTVKFTYASSWTDNSNTRGIYTSNINTPMGSFDLGGMKSPQNSSSTPVSMFAASMPIRSKVAPKMFKFGGSISATTKSPFNFRQTVMTTSVFQSVQSRAGAGQTSYVPITPEVQPQNNERDGDDGMEGVEYERQDKKNRR